MKSVISYILSGLYKSYSHWKMAASLEISTWVGTILPISRVIPPIVYAIQLALEEKGTTIGWSHTVCRLIRRQ